VRASALPSRPLLIADAGVIPPILLAIFMLLLPIVLRLLARFEGIPSRTGLELSLMDRFFGFQVINSFLIVRVYTVASARLLTDATGDAQFWPN
jgi:hypothetical protein